MRKPSARTALPIGAALLAVSAAASAVHPFGAARLPASTAALFQGAHSDSDAARIFATACANCHSERTV